MKPSAKLAPGVLVIQIQTQAVWKVFEFNFKFYPTNLVVRLLELDF